MYFSTVFSNCILQLYIPTDKVTRDMDTCEQRASDSSTKCISTLYFSTVFPKLFIFNLSPCQLGKCIFQQFLSNFILQLYIWTDKVTRDMDMCEQRASDSNTICISKLYFSTVFLKLYFLNLLLCKLRKVFLKLYCAIVYLTRDTRVSRGQVTATWHVTCLSRHFFSAYQNQKYFSFCLIFMGPFKL